MSGVRERKKGSRRGGQSNGSFCPLYGTPYFVDGQYPSVETQGYCQRNQSVRFAGQDAAHRANQLIDRALSIRAIRARHGGARPGEGG